MAFFGCFYFVWAAVLIDGWRNLLLLIPAVTFVAIVWSAIRIVRRAATDAYTPSERAEKIITAATIFEGVGIPIVALGLANTGHGDVVLPGIAAVVGLHFLPMAYAIPFLPFYSIGAALLLVAAAGGLVMTQPAGSIVTGLAGAFSLWIASLMALRRSVAPTITS